MSITPFSKYTDHELVLLVANQQAATPLETELMLRVQNLLDEVEDLKNANS